ncbi:MAG: protein-L-isoaspartate(D-aspartate) O-methyltransferase [Sphaerochaetaceae bacterium]|jgi:protein-L-isoaspartate(D-aspartate) O-methyltransferase
MKNNELVNFFQNLDRSKFLDNEYAHRAHIDAPLPIGHGQTISQPSLVLYMSEQLFLNKDDKVLEIGTGSGYQTIFLAHFAKVVYTVELIETLSLKAQKRLSEMGYNNIYYKIGDGSVGWVENQPFDKIVVTAAAKRIPTAIVEQLGPNGIMIAPVGSGYYQKLLKITKDKDGNVSQSSLLDVSFVELKGKYS